jgi:type II secretory pathway component PulC
MARVNTLACIWFHCAIIASASAFGYPNEVSPDDLEIVGCISSSVRKNSFVTVSFRGKVWHLREGATIGPYRITHIKQRSVMVHHKEKEREYSVGWGLSATTQEITILDEQSFSITSEFRQQIIDELLPDVAMSFTALPQFVGGVLTGFSLSNITPGSLIDKIGLKDGDLVVAINGMYLNTVNQAIAILHDAKNQQLVSVQYVRVGLIKEAKITVN